MAHDPRAEAQTECRWVAVRHGMSAGGNDHVHVAVSLVREDGTKASVWQESKKASRACIAIEDRLGLGHLVGRVTGRSVPEASRADTEISSRQGDGEPILHRLERKVRAIAAASDGETDFVVRARAHVLLVRPRLAPGGQEASGYAVAEENGRQAIGRNGEPGPVWFGGGSLAPDLSLPMLRKRWHPEGTPDPVAVAVWTAVAERAPRISRLPGPSRSAGRARDREVSAADVAGLLADPAPGLADPETREWITIIRNMVDLGIALGERSAERAEQRARDLAAARAVKARYGKHPSTGDLLRGIAGEYLAVTAIARRQGGIPATVTALGKLTAVCAVAAVTREARDEAERACLLACRHESAAAPLRPQAQPGPPVPESAAVASDDALSTLLAEPLLRRCEADPRRAGLRELLDHAKAPGSTGRDDHGQPRRDGRPVHRPAPHRAGAPSRPCRARCLRAAA